jgi:RNA polymerase sigma-70 factor (ECF subfamily)
MATSAGAFRRATPVDTIDGGVDADLVRQVVAGSQAALGQLYDRHAQAVYAAAMRTSSDPWIAAEVVQDAFLALWDHAERYDPDRAGLRAWLLTIARNRAIDHLRAARRRDRAVSFSSFGHEDDHAFAEWVETAGDLIGSASPQPGPETIASSHEVRETVISAVATLSPDERTAIMLAYGRGMSQSEIATALDVPIGTIKTRTRRALHHLREALARPESGRWGDEAPALGPMAPAGREQRLFTTGRSRPAPCLSAGC